MIYINQQVQEYEKVFKVGNMGAVSKVKIKVIQGMIQLDCPLNGSIESIIKIENEIR